MEIQANMLTSSAQSSPVQSRCASSVTVISIKANIHDICHHSNDGSHAETGVWYGLTSNF